jgi:Carboxypeptidase regulatory-like domain
MPLGSVSGKVLLLDRDEIIEDAALELTNVETGLRSNRTSNALGEYYFFFLVPGRYQLSVSKEGLVGQLNEFDVEPGPDTKVDIRLTPLACNVPPDGWKCIRKHDHDGPCAAVPTASGIVLTKSEVLILQKLLKGYVVGPSARAVLDKINAVKEN